MKDNPSSVEFEELLAYLKHARGFDFAAYKRSSLQRRVLKRLQQAGCETYAEYIDFLELHQEEFRNLFNTILINVTSFFRDPEAWDYLETEILPRIIGGASEDPIRVWVAGCASGEEAYSIAMLLVEALGTAAFRSRVKIYATDVDDEALAQCRTASYSVKETESIPPPLADRYFERVNDRIIFDRELRRSVIFGRHDLIEDAPISRIDLLLCRNTLMYFHAEAQDRILARFHFSLNEGGYLFLGKAETMVTHASLFQPVDLKNRIFKRTASVRMRDRMFMFTSLGDGAKHGNGSSGTLREAAFDTVPLAGLLLDNEQRLVAATERARNLFGIVGRDMGRLFQDFELSYRPVELRSGIEQCATERRRISHDNILWNLSTGDVAIMDIRISPVLEEGVVLGTFITFDDVTQFRRLQEELLNFNQELETAYEEVQSTNEELQTTNEELQSTVEELETTNEELQSTNEELETMNEELQSANEELETINEEMSARSEELNQANQFLESFLASLRDGVIVVDRNMEILAWNYRSEDLWGLRADEVEGKHLLNIDIGLPTEQLRSPIRACLVSAAVQRMELEATNRRGRKVKCQITFTPLTGATEPQGVILIIEALTAN